MAGDYESQEIKIQAHALADKKKTQEVKKEKSKDDKWFRLLNDHTWLQVSNKSHDKLSGYTHY